MLLLKILETVAFPTVSVAGEGEPATAALAQRGLELTRPSAAAE